MDPQIRALAEELAAYTESTITREDVKFIPEGKYSVYNIIYSKQYVGSFFKYNDY